MRLERRVAGARLFACEWSENRGSCSRLGCSWRFQVRCQRETGAGRPARSDSLFCSVVEGDRILPSKGPHGACNSTPFCCGSLRGGTGAGPLRGPQRKAPGGSRKGSGISSDFRESVSTALRVSKRSFVAIPACLVAAAANRGSALVSNRLRCRERASACVRKCRTPFVNNCDYT